MPPLYGLSLDSLIHPIHHDARTQSKTRILTSHPPQRPPRLLLQLPRHQILRSRHGGTPALEEARQRSEDQPPAIEQLDEPESVGDGED